MLKLTLEKVTSKIFNATVHIRNNNFIVDISDLMIYTCRGCIEEHYEHLP